MYRFGGATLDVTVLAVTGGMYRVIATEHDTTLGGVRFDELLAQHLAAEFQRFLCNFSVNQFAIDRFEDMKPTELY